MGRNASADSIVRLTMNPRKIVGQFRSFDPGVSFRQACVGGATELNFLKLLPRRR